MRHATRVDQLPRPAPARGRQPAATTGSVADRAQVLSGSPGPGAELVTELVTGVGRMWRFWGSLLAVLALATGCGDGGAPETSSPATGAAESAPAETSEARDGPQVPDPASLPEAAAPGSLAEADLPSTRDEIQAIFEGMPAELAGGQRTVEHPSPERFEVTYGTTEPVGCGLVGLQALDVSTGDFWPEGWTAEQVVSMFTTGADWEVDGFGRDGDLYWVTIQSSCGVEGETGEDVSFITMWGRSGSPWVLSAQAGTPEVRDELMAAFVAAAG